MTSVESTRTFRIQDFRLETTEFPVNIFEPQSITTYATRVFLVEDREHPANSVYVRAMQLAKPNFFSLWRKVQAVHLTYLKYQAIRDTQGNLLWCKQEDIEKNLLFSPTELPTLTFDQLCTRANQIHNAFTTSQKEIAHYQHLLKQPKLHDFEVINLDQTALESVTRITNVYRQINHPLIDTGINWQLGGRVFLLNRHRIYYYHTDKILQKDQRHTVRKIYDVATGCLKVSKSYVNKYKKNRAAYIAKYANPDGRFDYIVEPFEAEFPDELIMTFYKGGDLWYWSRNYHSPQEKWNCCFQVTRAAWELVKRGIIHYDMKLENIFIDGDSENGYRFKVADQDGDSLFDPETHEFIIPNKFLAFAIGNFTRKEHASIHEEWDGIPSKDFDKDEEFDKSEKLFVFVTAYLVFNILAGFDPFHNPSIRNPRYVDLDNDTYHFKDLTGLESYTKLDLPKRIRLEALFKTVFVSDPHIRPGMGEFFKEIEFLFGPASKEKEAEKTEEKEAKVL